MVSKTKGAVKNQALPNVPEPESSTSAQNKSSTRSPGRPRSPARTKSPARSPARTRSPVRTRSPARTKSPARKSPSRAKREASPPLQSSTPKVVTSPKARSPLRRSPSRKSPTRVTKSAETYLSERVQRPRRARALLEIESDSDNTDGDAFSLSEKPQAAVKGRARRLEVQVEKLKLPTSETTREARSSTLNIIRRMTQNSQNREIERVVHLKNFDSVAQKLGEFSDEDDTLQQQRKSVSVDRAGDLKQITEFGGPWGALFYTLVLPLSIVALFISCNENHCSFVKFPPCAKYLSLSTYFDLSSILGFTGYAVLLALLSVIPFGGRHVTGLPTKQGKFTYVMNGLFSFFVLLAVAIGLELRNIPITDFIVKHLFHLAVASILFGVALSVYAYIRSFYVSFSSLNVHVAGRSKIYGFFLGRELNPRLFGLLDLKMYVLRLAIIGSVIIDFAYLYRSLSWGSFTSTNFDFKALNGNSTLITLAMLHSIYYLDVLIHESAFVTSFEIQYEGFGYMAGTGYLVYPFMMAAVTKYVVDYEIRLSLLKLAAISLVFIFGYLLFRGSNNQKDAFRKNPYDPALSHLETIPTTKGKKLICSGFWGVVRHPNYLGDILMNLTFVPFAFDVPPVVTAVSIILLLIHRSVRDNIRCKQKYGAAWDRYCNKVKYVLLPKVY